MAFERTQIEPRLHGATLERYLEVMTPEAEAAAPGEATSDELRRSIEEALNVQCPNCAREIDPSPDGCIAMKCQHCQVAFCWCCFELCGNDAHLHAREVHGGYFPPRRFVQKWHKQRHWRKIDNLLQRAYPHAAKPGDSEGKAGRSATLALCQPLLEHPDIGLWPFPMLEPVVGGLKEESHPQIMAAQFGDLGRLETLLAAEAELLNAVDDRGMTALMAAAHGGFEDCVGFLLEQGADLAMRDEHALSALDYAVREDKRAAARALVKHAVEQDAQGKEWGGLSDVFGRRAFGRFGEGAMGQGVIPHDPSLYQFWLWADRHAYLDLKAMVCDLPQLAPLLKWHPQTALRTPSQLDDDVLEAAAKGLPLARSSTFEREEEAAAEAAEESTNAAALLGTVMAPRTLAEAVAGRDVDALEKAIAMAAKALADYPPVGEEDRRMAKERIDEAEARLAELRGGDVLLAAAVPLPAARVTTLEAEEEEAARPNPFAAFVRPSAAASSSSFSAGVAAVLTPGRSVFEDTLAWEEKRELVFLF